MRTISIPLLCLCLAMILAGCGSNSSGESEDQSVNIEASAFPVRDAKDVSNPLPDPGHKFEFPLRFPISGFTKDIILKLPDSRLPGAPRVYRGDNAKHEGMDFYTGKCGIPVLAPASGWVIDFIDKERFPSTEIRDAILGVTSKIGDTPEPILSNLQGVSIVLYHGIDGQGNHCYSRMSHFDRFSKEWKLGDYVERGETIGFVGASGTSAQFESAGEKKAGCHLHFEWHKISNGNDIALALDEKNNDLKRKLYYEMF
jgi:murein DD-endopeptidase MepM/ murein hydrolase activator NlpD